MKLLHLFNRNKKKEEKKEAPKQTKLSDCLLDITFKSDQYKKYMPYVMLHEREITAGYPIAQEQNITLTDYVHYLYVSDVTLRVVSVYQKCIEPHFPLNNYGKISVPDNDIDYLTNLCLDRQIISVDAVGFDDATGSCNINESKITHSLRTVLMEFQQWLKFNSGEGMTAHIDFDSEDALFRFLNHLNGDGSNPLNKDQLYAPFIEYEIGTIFTEYAYDPAMINPMTTVKILYEKMVAIPMLVDANKYVENATGLSPVDVNPYFVGIMKDVCLSNGVYRYESTNLHVFSEFIMQIREVCDSKCDYFLDDYASNINLVLLKVFNGESDLINLYYYRFNEIYNKTIKAWGCKQQGEDFKNTYMHEIVQYCADLVNDVTLKYAGVSTITELLKSLPKNHPEAQVVRCMSAWELIYHITMKFVNVIPRTKHEEYEMVMNELLKVGQKYKDAYDKKMSASLPKEDSSYWDPDIKSWDEFRGTGLFMITNQFLHIFGWAITYNPDKNECYPARVKYRGFSEDSVTRAYEKVQKYMVENAETIYKESDYDEGE